MALPSARHVAARPSRRGVRAGRAEIAARAFGAADLLVELDSGFRIANAAGAADSLIGREAGAVIGLSVTELVSPQDRPRLLDGMRRSVDSGRFGGPGHIGGMVVRLARPDGLAPHVRLAGYRPPGEGRGWHLAFRLHSCYQCPMSETVAADGRAACADAET